ILERLKKSPTLFTLDARQVAELEQAGASNKLLAAMQGQRGADEPGEVTDYAFILDCSGSMMDRTREGTSKMEVAKKVVSELIAKIPNGRRVTFIVYGLYKGRTVEEACQAVAVLRPFSPIDDAGKAELKRSSRACSPPGIRRSPWPCAPRGRSWPG